MGADLYIEPFYTENREKHQPAFDAACKKRDALPITNPRSPEWEAAQEGVSEAYGKMYAEGYFRDSYNGTSLAWVQGWSWWSDICPLIPEPPDDIDHEDFDSSLGDESIKKLREFASRPIPPVEEMLVGLKEHGVKIGVGEDSPESWHKYFVKKREALIAFCDLALERGYGIVASC